ncbi:MAG: hypothetical protein ACEQSH_00350 [Bacteroidia bacterium]
MNPDKETTMDDAGAIRIAIRMDIMNKLLNLRRQYATRMVWLSQIDTPAMSVRVHSGDGSFDIPWPTDEIRAALQRQIDENDGEITRLGALPLAAPENVT